MTIAYRIESALEAEAELRELLPAHMEEFERYGPPFEATPDFPTYHTLAQSGRLLMVGARDDSGALVGYWLGLLFADPHHRIRGEPAKVAMGMAYYIVPALRAHIAKKFFDCVEEAATRSGATMLSLRTRPEGRSGQFLEAIGYRLAEMVYVKPIGSAYDA